MVLNVFIVMTMFIDLVLLLKDIFILRDLLGLFFMHFLTGLNPFAYPAKCLQIYSHIFVIDLDIEGRPGGTNV